MPLARISQIVGTVLQDPERQILGTRVRNEVAFGLENLGLSRAEKSASERYAPPDARPATIVSTAAVPMFFNAASEASGGSRSTDR